MKNKSPQPNIIYNPLNKNSIFQKGIRVLRERFLLLNSKTTKTVHRSQRISTLIKYMQREGTLLDIGCGGIKHSTFDLLCATGNYSLIVGVDAHEPSVKERKAWAAKRKDGARFRFINSTAEKLKLGRTFDVILLSHVLEHLSSKEGEKLVNYLWKNCKRQMIIETPDQFEDGHNAVNEFGNPYQQHKSLIRQELLSKKGFRKIFTYYQESGFSNSAYIKEREEAEVKLNIGCGPYPEEGYVNIDKNPIWKPDKVLDVRKGLPYANGSLDEIKAHHFIEHLDKDEIIDFLALCYKKLKNNGTLDLLFPVGLTYDLDHKSYLEKRSFVPLISNDDPADQYRFGPKIHFELISEKRSRDKFCKMLRLILKARK